MASFKIIRQIVFQQGDPESGGGLFAQMGEPCLQGRCDEDPFLREAAGEQPLLQRRGLPFPYEDGIIAAGGGVFPELAVELILFIPQFDHAGSDQDPLGLESGQHIQGAAEAGGVGVVGVVDDPAGQELEPVFDGLEHPYRVDEILERDADVYKRQVMKRPQTVGDLSCVVTGLLLAYNLPSTIPLWQAALGSVVAIVVAKQMFGGLGQNFVNPALLGRIVLMGSFPGEMNNWVAPMQWQGADAISSATPLALMSQGGDPSAFSPLQLFVGMRGGCLGLCSSGPNVAVFPEGTIYSHVHVEDVAEIVSEHLLKGGRVDRLLYNENEATSTVRSLEETEFYKKQLRIALRNCGVIDPQNIDEYICLLYTSRCV